MEIETAHRQRGGDAWAQLRNTADKIWADLKTGISDAQSKFK